MVATRPGRWSGLTSASAAASKSRPLSAPAAGPRHPAGRRWCRCRRRATPPARRGPPNASQYGRLAQTALPGEADKRCQRERKHRGADRRQLRRGDQGWHWRGSVDRLRGWQLSSGGRASEHLVDVEGDVLDVRSDHYLAVVARGSEREEQTGVETAGSVGLNQL